MLIPCVYHSPYEQSRIVVVTVGHKNYSIPENCIHGQLLSQARASRNRRIILGDIDADIGHTILHFLYKGKYETIAYADIQPETDRIEIEYKRSVQVYYAARMYGLHGLDTLARNYIMVLSESLSIFQILRGVRLIFSKLPEDEEWFHNYLHSKLSSSFTKDETTFQLDEFYSEILDDPTLSKAVLKYIVQAFTTETSRLRNLSATSVGNETRKDGSGPSCEKPPPEPVSETTNDRNGVECRELASIESRVAENPSAHHEEQPCGEPAIEFLPDDSQVATPKAHYDQGRNHDTDWSCLSGKERKEIKKRMRLAQQQARSETV